MDKSILNDKVYKQMLEEARKKREARHTQVKENTKTVVRKTHVFIVAHS